MCLLNRNRPSLASISSSSTQQRSNAGDSLSRFIKRPLTVLRQPFIFIVVQRWWGSRETARSTWPTLRTRPPRTLKTGYVSGATQSQQWRLALTSSFSSTPPTAVCEAILQDQTRHLRSHAEGALQTQVGQEGFTVDGRQTQMRKCTRCWFTSAQRGLLLVDFRFLINVVNICRLSA